MSTRCQVSFNYGTTRTALIYKHSDGYPDGESGMFQTIENFFLEVKASTNDTRFGDPCYLAAKFVVHLAAQFAAQNRLDFLSVGISMNLHGDIEYLYTIDCDHHKTEHPFVSVQEVNGNGKLSASVASPFSIIEPVETKKGSSNIIDIL